MRTLLLLLLTSMLSGFVAAQERVARVGELLWRTDGPYYELTQRGFVEGLREQGFVEGRNLVLLLRSADSDPERFKPLARELARAKVDVFFAAATPMATGAWYADRNTPIVIATILDPVKLDFVKSLARPGTRVTGVTTMNKELTGKRLQLLTQVVPGLKRVGVILDEAMRDACKQEVEAQETSARQLGVKVVYAHIGGVDEVDAGFRKLVAADVQAVLSTLTSTRNGLEREYAAAALKYRLPSMFEADGGLVFLGEWMTNGKLAEGTAAQLGFEYEADPPFAGRKGRTRLAVVDGVVNEAVVRLVVSALGERERVVVCGTGIDIDARPVLRELRPGSTLRKIPAALLDEYRSIRQLQLELGNPDDPAAMAVHADG